MLTIRFSCWQCGLKDAEASVRARDPGEDIAAWMRDAVGSALFFVHTVESPQCRCRNYKDVKIPIEDGPKAYVGQQTDRVPPKGQPECRE